MTTCRICKKLDGRMFKYSTRHYAHAGCGFKKFGATFLDMLPQHMLGQLPFFAIEDAGLLPEVDRRMREET